MTLPIPPSDSLYKFCGIGGFFIVVLSVYVPFQMKSDLGFKLLEINLSFEELRIESEGLVRASEHRVEELENLEADPTELERLQGMINKDSGTEKKYLDPKEIRKQLNELQARQTVDIAKWEKRKDILAQIESDVDKYSLIFSKMMNLSGKAKFLTAQRDVVNQYSWFTLGIGIMMMRFGFWNWYWKSQVHQDSIAQNQAAQWVVTRVSQYEKEEIPG